MKNKLALLLVFWVLVFVPFVAMAESVFTFEPICNCSDGCLLGVGEKLKLYAYEESGSVYLKLLNENSGENAPFIGEIYFYDYGSWNIRVTISGGYGTVNYVIDNVHPDHLSGWDKNPFWMADTYKEGRNEDGIDAGEYLILQISNISLNDLVSALEQGKLEQGTNGGLIFGIHVKGTEDWCGVSSCSYIQTTGGANPVPIPPAINLLGSGLLGVSFLARKRKK